MPSIGPSSDEQWAHPVAVALGTQTHERLTRAIGHDEALLRFVQGVTVDELTSFLRIAPLVADIFAARGMRALLAERGIVRLQVEEIDPLRRDVRLLLGEEAGKRLDLARFEPLERRYANSIVRAVVPVGSS